MPAVQSAPDGLVVDTNTKLTAADLTLLAGSRWNGQLVQGVVRYVSIHAEAHGDIDAAEIQAALSAGLGVMLVQHVRYPGWTATEAQGAIDGAAAAANARAAGYLPGCHLWLDLEGVANVGDEVIAYVNAWASAVVAAGFLAGLYVGYSCGLTPKQLYESLPDIHAYWSDFGQRSVERRGFCMKQHPQCLVAGIQVDPDEVMADALGGRPMWMVAG